MDSLKNATDKPLIIINESMQFSAGKFPVVSAPSGLTLGGGFEVLVQSNFVASHTNIVVGLVETLVGLVPAGVKHWLV